MLFSDATVADRLAASSSHQRIESAATSGHVAAAVVLCSRSCESQRGSQSRRQASRVFDKHQAASGLCHTFGTRRWQKRDSEFDALHVRVAVVEQFSSSLCVFALVQPIAMSDLEECKEERKNSGSAASSSSSKKKNAGKAKLTNSVSRGAPSYE